MNDDLPERIRPYWHQPVKLTGPTGAIWRGKLVAYLDQPSIVLEQADGTWAHVPASFHLALDDVTVPAGDLRDLLAWVGPASGLSSDARATVRRLRKAAGL